MGVSMRMTNKAEIEVLTLKMILEVMLFVSSVTQKLKKILLTI